MKKTTRILRVTAIVILSIAITLVVAGYALSRYVLSKADARLKAVNASIGSLNINLFNQTISLRDVEWTYKDDTLSTIPHHVFLKHLKVGGIDIRQFIKFRKIRIGTLVIMDGDLRFNTAIKGAGQQGEVQLDLGDISVDKIALNNIKTSILRDSVEEYAGTTSLILNGISLTNIKLAKDLASYQIKSFEAVLKKLRIAEKGSLYKTQVGQIFITSTDQRIVIDSLKLIPTLSKYKFSRKVGRQSDRIDLLIPKLAITGIDFPGLKDTAFTAKKIEINNAKMYVFKDKRLPFVRDHNLPLPIAMIRKLKFGAAVDSVKINNAAITYEEFPEKGFKTGLIRFEKLNAVLDHISNRNHFPDYKHATLVTTAHVMGKGMIKAQFTFPYGKQQIYTAKGTITNLPLNDLNPILESLAFMSIERGTLNRLDFNFDYNDIRSTGNILINYEDLKITSLTKEKESVTNEFKTWALNVFIKKDKDHTVSEEKRTGVVEYERDRRRAIINIWVRSLFSGLKSSVLDSPAKKDKEKDKRKSKRERRRESRKEAKEKENAR